MYAREIAERVVGLLKNEGVASLSNELIVAHRDLGKELEAAIKRSGLSVSAEYDFIGAKIVYRREGG